MTYRARSIRRREIAQEQQREKDARIQAYLAERFPAERLRAWFYRECPVFAMLDKYK